MISGLILLLAFCGHPVAAQSPSPSPSASPTPSFTLTNRGSASDDRFLLTIETDATQVTTPARPQRVLSLSPANTEITFALGAGDRLLGGTDFDDFPADEVGRLTHVATFNGVLMEQVVDWAASEGPSRLSRIRSRQPDYR